jgi:hypothetical protein
LEIGIRLREQAWRLAVAHDTSETFPEKGLELERLEQQGIHTTARRLANATRISAMSLEVLIDALERYNTDVQIVRQWQV